MKQFTKLIMVCIVLLYAALPLLVLGQDVPVPPAPEIKDWNGIVAAIALYLTPIVTAGIRVGWLALFNAVPWWAAPVRALLAGLIVSTASKLLHFQLPADPSTIQPETVSQLITGLLTNGALIGGLSFFVTQVVDKLKAAFPNSTIVGKIAAALLRHVGRPETSVQAPAPAK